MEKKSRLTYLKDAGKNKFGYKIALYLCECGKETLVRPISVKRLDTMSCGCLQKKRATETFKKHGLFNHPLYKVFYCMKNRCEDENHDNYQCYGGRGIKICDEWSELTNFIEWGMKAGYKKGLRIDRIDNDKGYEPSNCRWVTPKQNSNNRRNNVYLTYKGETHSVAIWGQKLGIYPYSLYARVKIHGLNMEKILEKPFKRSKKARYECK